MVVDQLIFSLQHDWFGWPNGAVLTNLIATAICVALGAWKVIVWARKLLRSHDEIRVVKLDALHAQHKELHGKIDRLQEQQESESVPSAVVPPPPGF